MVKTHSFGILSFKHNQTQDSTVLNAIRQQLNFQETRTQSEHVNKNRNVFFINQQKERK